MVAYGLNHYYHLQKGYWTHDVSFGSVDGTLEYYRCPPGYCRCSGNNVCNSIYYYDNNDLQCVCDRQGIVCMHACSYHIEGYVILVGEIYGYLVLEEKFAD